MLPLGVLLFAFLTSATEVPKPNGYKTCILHLQGVFNPKDIKKEKVAVVKLRPRFTFIEDPREGISEGIEPAMFNRQAFIKGRLRKVVSYLAPRLFTLDFWINETKKSGLVSQLHFQSHLDPRLQWVKEPDIEKLLTKEGQIFEFQYPTQIPLRLQMVFSHFHEELVHEYSSVETAENRYFPIDINESLKDFRGRSTPSALVEFPEGTRWTIPPQKISFEQFAHGHFNSNTLPILQTYQDMLDEYVSKEQVDAHQIWYGRSARRDHREDTFFLELHTPTNHTFQILVFGK